MNFLPLGLFAAGLLFCLVFTAFGCTIVVSLASVAIACNQTLSSIMVQSSASRFMTTKRKTRPSSSRPSCPGVLLLPYPWRPSVPHPGALPLPSTFTCSHSGAGCAHLFANVNRGLSND